MSAPVQEPCQEAYTPPPRGLPEHLPPGETLLWQGAPAWRGVAQRVFRVRLVGLYFLVLIAWQVASNLADGVPAAQIAVSTATLGGLGLAATLILNAFGWLVARTTVYSITSARVVLHFGIALPMTISIPFKRLAGAALKVYADGTGDIPVSLKDGDRIAYLVVWPHARPWRMTQVEPMLRAVPDAARVAEILGRAMVAHAAVESRKAAGAAPALALVRTSAAA